MSTDLFVFGRSVPIPPECRRPIAPLPVWTPTGSHEAVLELPPMTPRFPAARILPSLSLRFSGEYMFRFEARVDDADDWTAASPVGVGALNTTAVSELDTAAAGTLNTAQASELSPAAKPAKRGSPLRAEIDLFVSPRAAAHVCVRVRLHAEDLQAALRAPMLVSVSLSDEQTAADTAAGTGRIQLDVPPLSQMDMPADLRHRVCSPTAVAMVLGYWKRPVGVEALAVEMFDARHDLYGVWPAAIRAAARHGIEGYLLRFPSWSAAAWCLEQAAPVIASIRYAAGELGGAAIEATPGHLIVLTGYERDMVLVNDPAAPAAGTVPRQYALADLRRVWLSRTGVGYVLFPPPPGSGA
jgi:Peptidase_C39 like family